MKKMDINSLFSMKNPLISEYLEKFTYPWEALGYLKEEIVRIGESLNMDEYDKIGDSVWISKSAIVSPTAFIGEPSIICAGAEIRHGAFIRGSAFVGEGAVVGNSTEVKNAIILDKAQAPHFNYVGDSILGYGSHIGGGVILSNLKADKMEVVVRAGNEAFHTKLKKVGSFLGDFVEVGCQSVLNPGTVVGQRTNIYPLSMVRGYVPEKSIYKKAGEIVEKYERS